MAAVAFVVGDDGIAFAPSAPATEEELFNVLCVISSRGVAEEENERWAGAALVAEDGDREQSSVSSLRSVRFDALIDFPPDVPFRDDKDGSLPAIQRTRI